MQENIHPAKNKNELIAHASEMANEAFRLFDLSNLNGLDPDELVENLFSGGIEFGAKPLGDLDRDSWMAILGLCYVGYFTQQKEMGMLGTEESFVADLESQIILDQKQFGSTWKEMLPEGQFDRSYARFREYRDKYKKDDQPFPWLKVASATMICLVRIDHPEYQK